jgi:hypothetical protein
MHERDCRFVVGPRVGPRKRLAEKGILFPFFNIYIGDNHSHKKERLEIHGISRSRTGRSIR